MASNSKCIICKKTEDKEPGLKLFGPDRWEKARDAAARRLTLQTDRFFDVSEEIRAIEQPEGKYYHTNCFSQFCACAIKRQPYDDNEPSQPPKKVTRSTSGHPSTNERGVLGDSCLFCGKMRKRRKSQRSEPLSQCLTMDGCKSIVCAAMKKGDTRILGLGEDLIAKEAKYHNSCRRNYVREVDEDEELQTSTRKKHNEAFQKLLHFLDNELIKKKKPMLLASIFSMYKEEFLALGGSCDDISNYSVQSLMTKVKGHFEDSIVIDKQANKSGNVVFPSCLTSTEAFALLHDSSDTAEKIRSAAIVLRTEILAMPPSRIPSPTSVHTLKDNAPSIPPLTLLFFRTLVGGMQSETTANPEDTIERKAMACASDAVFNCTRGKVCPWKHQLLGLGLGTLTGSKLLLTVLNRFGHSISYSEVKGLETEMAYSCSDGGLETPAGLHLCNTLATGLAWDNYDVNTETLDGKNTLHSTVGICYQNQLPPCEMLPDQQPGNTVGLLTGRMRRRFHGSERTIPPFRASLKQAHFKLAPVSGECWVEQKGLDFTWLLQSFTHKLPLFTGFFSQFVIDKLPKTSIAYMDPISLPPTRNDVVQETMVRSVKVAQETRQGYAVVTYDLAIALKAYCIQALQAPAFDDLIILLGNFHLELAFFGAVGTYLADSGVEYLLNESGALAEGSVTGFMKGKFYNRCTRIHQILAAVLERELFSMFLKLMEEESLATEMMSSENITLEYCKGIVNNASFVNLMKKYETFFHEVIDGKCGSTAAYWAIYVYLINRVHRELKRAVHTNDIDEYIRILPSIVEVCFALNRPNYSRWGSLFLYKLKQMDPRARDILKAGAMSIRRTKKSYARSAIDLTLEQTVNKYAASPMRGITAFRDSEDACRRWSITLTQRSMALSELYEMVNLQSGEQPEKQLTTSRIRRDNADMNSVTTTLTSTCNPFDDAPADLVNISSGKAANEETTKFLLSTLKRGRTLRIQFETECSEDESRFLKPVARTKVMNFAAENRKRSKAGTRKVNAAEGVRDVFGRILAVVAETSDNIDLHHILSYPITDVPLSLAHSDGIPLKTDKATLTKVLESKQEAVPTDSSITPIKATVIDGGIMLHETVMKHSKSTYGMMAKDLLTKICSCHGEQVHLVLDKYQTPSIKDPERNLRYSSAPHAFTITGPDQSQRQSGIELLKNVLFKEAFACFLMEEWKRPQYGPILGGKTVYISHGGACMKMEQKDRGVLETERPDHLQCQHEEADTLLAFHANSIASGNIMVRSTDTDVFIILLGLAGKREGINIILDYGSGNHRRYIGVSELAGKLEEEQSGITEALIGLHALTGCDFTSCFYRKGKVKPFQRLASNADHIAAMQSLTTEEVDIPGITAFVCLLYGFRTSNITEARYKAFMRMSGGKGKDLQANLKKINCASLPPCEKTLLNHIKRAQYVARMWKRADETNPTRNASPTDYGWKLSQNCFEPDWFQGISIPQSLTRTLTSPADANGGEITSSDDEEPEDDAWSENCDSDDDLNY